jgi:hypothetical protein
LASGADRRSGRSLAPVVDSSQDRLEPGCFSPKGGFHSARQAGVRPKMSGGFIGPLGIFRIAPGLLFIVRAERDVAERQGQIEFGEDELVFGSPIAGRELLVYLAGVHLSEIA